MSAQDEQVGGDHYRKMEIQPAVFCQRNSLGYLESMIIKYACRHQDKGRAQDLRKIIHAAQLLLEIEYGEIP